MKIKCSENLTCGESFRDWQFVYRGDARLAREQEKGGEPKALQPGNHALGSEAAPFQLGNEEKQNDPVADPVELTQRCWGTLPTHPHKRRQLPMHAAHSPKDRGASTHQSEHQRRPSWHQQQHYVYHTYSTLCLLLPRSSNLHNQYLVSVSNHLTKFCIFQGISISSWTLKKLTSLLKKTWQQLPWQQKTV